MMNISEYASAKLQEMKDALEEAQEHYEYLQSLYWSEDTFADLQLTKQIINNLRYDIVVFEHYQATSTHNAA